MNNPIPAANAMDLNIPNTIGTPTPPVAEPEPQKTAEQQRIEALEAELRAQREQNSQLLNIAMQGRPAPSATPAPQPVPEFDLADIPDPVTAPKDFMTGLTQKIRQRDHQIRTEVTQNVTTQVTRGAALDSLYNRFTNQHGELAKKGALLQGAAALEFQALQARGIDPVAVAQQNPDSLIASIAARMNTELGVTPGANGGAAPNTPANAARTAGIATGSTPGGGAPPPAPAGKSFTDQIKAQQKAMGLY